MSITKEIDTPLIGTPGKYTSTATNVVSPLTCYRNRFDCDRIETLANNAGIYDRLPIDDKKHYYSVLVSAINECKRLTA